MDPHLTSKTKINFSNVVLNVNGKIKFPEDNLLKEYLHDSGVGKGFFKRNFYFILTQAHFSLLLEREEGGETKRGRGKH